MSRFVIPLEDVRVASPCRADWDAMQGDERSRFCGSCQKHVYNLSTMTRREAEALISSKEGKLCVRYYRRADGTILTQDCPLGLAKARRVVLAPLKWLAAGAALLIASGIWVFSHQTTASGNERTDVVRGGTSLRDLQPFKFIADLVSPPPAPTSDITAITGEFEPLSTPIPAPSPPPPPPPPTSTPPALVASESSSNSAIPQVLPPL